LAGFLCFDNSVFLPLFNFPTFREINKTFNSHDSQMGILPPITPEIDIFGCPLSQSLSSLESVFGGLVLVIQGPQKKHGERQRNVYDVHNSWVYHKVDLAVVLSLQREELGSVNRGHDRNRNEDHHKDGRKLHHIAVPKHDGAIVLCQSMKELARWSA